MASFYSRDPINTVEHTIKIMGKISERGYTMMELIMVVGIVALLSLTATALLLASLSGTGKASALAVVKQNGDFAIGVIERLVRDGMGVSCTTVAGFDELTVTDANGTTTFKVENDTSLVPAVPRIASNSASFPQNYLTSEKIQASNFQCTHAAGSDGVPDVVFASFHLTVGNPGVDRPSDVAQDTFETRVSLRTY